MVGREEVNLVRPRDRSHGRSGEREGPPPADEGEGKRGCGRRCGDAPHKEARRSTHQVNSILAFELSIVSSSLRSLSVVQVETSF